MEGAVALRRFKTGQLVLIQGKTNVQNRKSVRNWLTKQSLDVVMHFYQILQEENDAISTTKTQAGTSVVNLLLDPALVLKTSSMATPRMGLVLLDKLRQKRGIVQPERLAN
jgi:hypothetical protein